MFSSWALFFAHAATTENASLDKMVVTSSHIPSSAFLEHLHGETATHIRAANV